MAGRFSQSIIESIREAGDIVRLISDYVPLKPAGSRLKGLCPFHEEKTPSFSVDAQKQLFYCFGCRAGGDAFKFVQLYEKVEFPEAVEMLAKRWGVALPSERPGTEDPRARLLAMNDAAAGCFRAVLADGEAGAACRKYLESRGISDETVSRHGIGYAPAGWEGLRSHLLARGFKPEEMLRGGLVAQRRSGRGEYDRFRGRLIFPIRDVHGKVVAFGGRILDQGEPKYINSPETPAYTKGQHLYGLDLARDAIRREGLAIIVEGYLDLIAVAQAGMDNVVASLGTAFTPAQARLLSRYTDRVVVSYDADNAGAAAAERSVDLLLEKGFEVRVAGLPPGKDPDDVIRQDGVEAYAALIQRAPEFLEYLIRREARTRNLGRLDEQVAAVNAVLPRIARLSNAIERSAWATKLADALLIEDQLVLQELRKSLRAARPSIRAAPATVRQPTQAEARLVALLLRSADERRQCAELLEAADLQDSPVARIVHTILELDRNEHKIDYPAVAAALEQADDVELLNRIAFRDDPEEGPGIEDCLHAFRRHRLQREGQAVLRQLGRTQTNGPIEDPAAVDRELLRLQELARQRDRMS